MNRQRQLAGMVSDGDSETEPEGTMPAAFTPYREMKNFAVEQITSTLDRLMSNSRVIALRDATVVVVILAIPMCIRARNRRGCSGRRFDELRSATPGRRASTSSASGGDHVRDIGSKEQNTCRSATVIDRVLGIPGKGHSEAAEPVLARPSRGTNPPNR